MSFTVSRTGARVALLTIPVLVLTALLATPGFGAAPKKTYSLAVASASPAPEDDSGAFFGGQTVRVAVTLTNSPKSQQSLGSANVSLPSQYTAVSLVSVVTNPA